jgi:phosphatidate cytidylyltransferase
MSDPDFINPLQNPLFMPILLRLDFVFLVSFLLIAFLKKFDWGKITHSSFGEKYFGWLVLAPFYIFGVFFGRIPGLLVLLLFLYLAITEICKVSKLPSIYKYSLLFLSVVSVFVASYYTQFFYSLPIFYFMVITSVAIRRNDSKTSFNHASTTLFYAIWIIFGLCHFVLLSHLSDRYNTTKLLLILVIFAVSLSDVGAYVFGKFFHKIHFLDQYKIADSISPNKTYVGVLGHIIGAFAGIMILYINFEKIFSFQQVIILSIIIGVFGVVGGLTNSMFKRYYDVKDSSYLIPGLGGVLDRIDSLVRVVIVIYYYLLFFPQH